MDPPQGLAALDTAINKADFPYGIKEFHEWFPPGSTTPWMAFYNPVKQAELDKKRHVLWLKYVDHERVSQVARFQAAEAERKENERIKDINRRACSGQSSTLTAEEKRFVVQRGIQLAKPNPKKRKRTAANPAAEAASPRETADPPKAPATAGATDATSTAATSPETTTSPANTTNTATEPVTPTGDEIVDLDATLAAIDAEHAADVERAAEAGKRQKKEEKGFEYWAGKKIDYEPRGKPKRGGQKAKRQRERKREAARIARLTGPMNWNGRFNIRRSSHMREFVREDLDAVRREEWRQVVQSFSKKKRSEPPATANKQTRLDMFAPPAEYGDDDEANPSDIAQPSNKRADFAQRYMTGLGWQQGQGLGAEGNEGIVNALYMAKKKGGLGVIKGGHKA